MAKISKQKHGGRITNNDIIAAMQEKGQQELSLNCRLDLPAIPPAYKTSRNKVHSEKRHCSL
eukprot:9494567-Pyramimonas_sp.AAC.1